MGIYDIFNSSTPAPDADGESSSSSAAAKLPVVANGSKMIAFRPRALASNSIKQAFRPGVLGKRPAASSTASAAAIAASPAFKTPSQSTIAAAATAAHLSNSPKSNTAAAGKIIADYAPSTTSSVEQPLLAVLHTPFQASDKMVVLVNEYDPSRPNDYDTFREYVRHQKRLNREILLEEAKQKHRKPTTKLADTLSNYTKSLQQQQQKQQEHHDSHRGAAKKQKTTLSPPPSSPSSSLPPPPLTLTSAPPPEIDMDMSGEEAYQRRLRLSGMAAVPAAQTLPPPPPPAQLATVSSSINSSSLSSSKHAGGTVITAAASTVSKVILLTNMVGPGEADDDLESETAEECAKYGRVEKCVIHELQGVVDDEAVRIFVKFANAQGAVSALNDLNGRFFGGRRVLAAFYDEKMFLAKHYT